MFARCNAEYDCGIGEEDGKWPACTRGWYTVAFNEIYRLCDRCGVAKRKRSWDTSLCIRSSQLVLVHGVGRVWQTRH